MTPIKFDETLPDDELAELVYSTAIVSHREAELGEEMARFMKAIQNRAQLGRPPTETLMMAVQHLKLRHQIHVLQHQLVTMDISREMGTQLRKEADHGMDNPDGSAR
jgi:hypothetical protein